MKGLWYNVLSAKLELLWWVFTIQLLSFYLCV